jgi:hypothetical protein
MSASPATSDDADVLVSAVGHAQLCAELEALRTVSRREMSEQLRDVREEGDPDNPLLFDCADETAARYDASSPEDTQGGEIADARFPEPQQTRYREGLLPD